MKMQKRQFRIGELAKTLGVERFVIRFWEKEFHFTAHRSEGGQRFYDEKDLMRFKYIKKLLYEQGFTIAGAKKQLFDKTSKKDLIIASQKTSLSPEESEELMQKTASASEASQKKVIEQLYDIRERLCKIQKILSF